jgi:hypothetical protein
MTDSRIRAPTSAMNDYEFQRDYVLDPVPRLLAMQALPGLWVFSLRILA